GWIEGLEAALFMGVIPSLDRAGREPHDSAIGHLVGSRRDLAQVLLPVAVLQARADQGPEHTEPPQRDGALVLVVHGPYVSTPRGHKRWDRICTPRRPTGTRRSLRLT